MLVFHDLEVFQSCFDGNIHWIYIHQCWKMLQSYLSIAQSDIMHLIRRYFQVRFLQLCYADYQLILHQWMQGVSNKTTVIASMLVSEVKTYWYVLTSQVVLLVISLILVLPSSMDVTLATTNVIHIMVKLMIAVKYLDYSQLNR